MSNAEVGSQQTGRVGLEDRGAGKRMTNFARLGEYMKSRVGCDFRGEALTDAFHSKY